MTFLTLVRHAKSSWKNPRLADFDRPLNKRGRKNGPQMAKRFVEAGCRPDLIVSSPARRARDTALCFAEAWGGDAEDILFMPLLYEAGVDDLLAVVRDIRSDYSDILLVGHNPGMTEFANFLAPCRLENMVTCGLVRLALEIPQWRDAREQCGRMLFYDFPKRPLSADCN